MVVGLQIEFSFTGNFLGFPTTMKVLPRINLHFIFKSRIFSRINKVDFALISISDRGFSNEAEWEVFPAKCIMTSGFVFSINLPSFEKLVISNFSI